MNVVVLLATFVVYLAAVWAAAIASAVFHLDPGLLVGLITLWLVISVIMSPKRGRR